MPFVGSLETGLVFSVLDATGDAALVGAVTIGVAGGSGLGRMLCMAATIPDTSASVSRDK
jgi:hypothetical protein